LLSKPTLWEVTEQFAGTLLHSCCSNSTRAKCLTNDEFDGQRPYLIPQLSALPLLNGRSLPIVAVQHKLSIEAIQSAKELRTPTRLVWGASPFADRSVRPWYLEPEA
jgi:hypothetical protein